MTAPQQADSALIAAIDSYATDVALRLAPDSLVLGGAGGHRVRGCPSSLW